MFGTRQIWSEIKSHVYIYVYILMAQRETEKQRQRAGTENCYFLLCFKIMQP